MRTTKLTIPIDSGAPKHLPTGNCRAFGSSPDGLRSPAVDGLDVLAWTLVLIVGSLLIAAILLLGAPLGRLLHARPMHVLPIYQPLVQPKPSEQARYVFAVFAVLLSAATVALVPRSALLTISRRRRTGTGLILTSQFAVLGILAWAWIGQSHGLSGLLPDHFHASNLAVALIIACTLAIGTARGWLGWGPRDHLSWTRWIWRSVTIVLICVWIAPGLYRALNIAHASFAVSYPLQFTFDDFASVLDGRTPLVNYDTQYASLTPFVLEPVLSLLGPSIGVFTAIMCGLSLIAFLCVERSLVLVSRNERTAFALFLPLIAVSLFIMRSFGNERYTMGNYFAVFPIRYLGPYVLLWLTLRHLRGLRPRSTTLLFLFGALIAINNLDFGLPALAGSVAAIGVARLSDPEWRPHDLLVLARRLVLAATAAALMVILFLLLRTDQLPSWSRWTRYDEIFARTGFNLIPTPNSGLHIIVYLTFAAAFIVAAMRARARSPDHVFTGALAFSGLFGLGSGFYYMGRSHPEVLVALFSAWALSGSLLALLALRAIERQWRELIGPRMFPATASLLCVGLFATAISQVPAPWAQWRRLRESSHHLLFDMTPEANFVASLTHPGQHVALITTLGHLVARQAHVIDVTPYSNPDAIVTYEQAHDVLELLRRERGYLLFTGQVRPEITAFIRAQGLHVVASDPRSQLQAWLR